VKELVELIAQALVDQPEKVTVSQIESEQNTTLELNVAPKIWARLSAEQGRTARASGLILGAAGIEAEAPLTISRLSKK